MAVAQAADLRRSFQSMASDIELRVVKPHHGAETAFDEARSAVEGIAANLTRFDPQSPLSRMNAVPSAWHKVPETLATAVAESERAHRQTGGLFDPRVIDTLLEWGYDRSFDEMQAHQWEIPSSSPALVTGREPIARWCPAILNHNLIHLGGQPIDLGGIGKGLAVRAAASLLAGAGESVLVNAGGDLWAGGLGPDGDGWKVGVEDPTDRSRNLLILALSDIACATSSIVRRRWTVSGRSVHHLIDPRTRTPGGAGLASVTVVDPDPARAEVWSKSLFLTGIDEIAAYAMVYGLAAAWVGIDGSVGVSNALADSVRWQVRP